MTTPAPREEDSVQFSLEALRELELERVREETLEAERRDAERQERAREAARLEAERARAEAERLARVEHERRLHLETEKLRLQAQEQQLRLELEAQLEHKRFEAALRRDQATNDATSVVPRRGWFWGLLLIVVASAQGFTLHQLNAERSSKAAIEGELEAAGSQLSNLKARLDRALAARDAKAATPTPEAIRSARKSASTPPGKRKIDRPRDRHRPGKRQPQSKRVVLDCDPTTPLGCARR